MDSARYVEMVPGALLFPSGGTMGRDCVLVRYGDGCSAFEKRNNQLTHYWRWKHYHYNPFPSFPFWVIITLNHYHHPEPVLPSSSSSFWATIIWSRALCHPPKSCLATKQENSNYDIHTLNNPSLIIINNKETEQQGFFFDR